MTTTVRAAALDDAMAIADVDVASHVSAYRHIFGDGYDRLMTPKARIERWQHTITNGASDALLPDQVLVAEEDRSITGYVAFGRSLGNEIPDTGEIVALFVHPSHWRSGTGHLLMAEAMIVLREAGFGEAVLWALEDNNIGRAFYEREGWQLDGPTRTPPHGKPEVRYRKRIDPL